ncbi:MAG: leucine-rich repeat domain-containing protein, partial [Acutalibacteraceae bacterium]
MFKKFLSLILAGVILFSGGSVAFAETTEDIRQILRLANSVTSQDEASYTDEAEAIEGTNTDAEQQATSDVTTEDENKYITWKEADEIFMSEFGDKNNYYDLFHPYVTLGGLAYRIWLTEGSPVMDDKVTNGSPSEDEKLNDFGNTWWYCALNKIIDENVLNHIVMKEDRFYSLNELRITQSDFQYIIDNYKKVRAKNSAGLRQASKPQNVKTFSNNDNKSIRSKSYADDSVIDYKITCIIGNYCIVGKPRLPDNGNILQNSYIPNNGFIVKIINNDNIADILSNQNDDCLFFHNGNVYSSIYELLREERVDSSLDLLDVFCLYYGKTSEIGDVEITIDYNNGINHFENYQNMNSINLPELTRSGYNFDGFYVCKKEIDNDGNIIVLWHCINSKGEYQWLTEETKEYKKTKLDKNTIVFNTGDESISFVAQWKTWTDAGYFTYNKNKTTKTVTITDYVGTDTDVVIPASIDGYSVTSIGSSAFSGCTRLRRLTSVTIPDSVTSIGGAAFSDCTSLTSITIPDSVTSIGDSAFNSCTSLTSITIPNSVTSIGNWAFYYCTSLTSITIPDSVTNIGYKMFSDCTSLTSITIPDSVTSIGLNAFSNCISLTNINVDSNNEEYTSIDGVLFTKNVKILVCYPCGKKDIEYIIPSSVTSISCDAFSHCKSLTSITIPDRVTSIGNAAFDSCKSLTSIIIPDGVTSIGNDAFRYCTGLTSIIIPDSVTSIGNDAFRYCTGLTSIII